MKNEYLHIGCQYHTISEWESFTDNEILEMDGKDGLRWWREWKDVVINVAKLYIEQIKELQKKD